MADIPNEAVAVVYDDMRAVIDQTDDALLSNATLMVSVMKAARNSAQKFSDKHRLFMTVHEANAKMLESRRSVGDTLKLLRVMADTTGHGEMLEGCAGACPANPLLKPAVALEGVKVSASLVASNG